MASKKTTISVDPDVLELAQGLGAENGWSTAHAARVAFEALETLLELHSGTAEKAAEPDVGKLFRALSRLMPAGLVEGKPTDWGRLQDGRPALILDDYYFSIDANGEVMAIRGDGREVADVQNGKRRVIANVETVEEIASRN
jgi:hypothetical protein